MKIEIDLPEKVSTNEIYAGKHWTVRKKHKDDWRLIVKAACKGKKPIKEYPVDLYFLFYLTGRRFDTGNCSYMCKLIEDGLVHIGILENDSVKYVNIWHIDPPSRGKTDRCVVDIV